QFYKVIAAQGMPNCRINSQSFRVNRSSTYTLSVVIKRGTESLVTIQGQTYLSSPPYNSTYPRHNVNIDDLTVSGGGEVRRIGSDLYLFTITYQTQVGDGSERVYVQFCPGNRGKNYQGGEFTQFGALTFAEVSFPTSLIIHSNTT